ncbi:unnamed protein product [Owenia fusiformis]|uniref:Uncharacterized protein n=1 Tax=Owenia fusiformis TaxID=6347 RepID=A0A8J1TIV9_OWEFU|nr:unnamed protein product [Owenia fusiformis]
MNPPIVRFRGMNMVFYSVVGFVYILCTIVTGAAENTDIESIDELNDAIAQGPNRKIGFLSMANYNAVRTVLHASVEPVLFQSKDALVSSVLSGSLVAGLMRGVVADHHAKDLHTFSSGLISTSAMFMTPDVSADMPHGAPPYRSSRDLALAINAAIVRVQNKGSDQEARLKNMPFEFLSVHTCKSDNYALFPPPNKNNATGLLKTILETRVFKLGAFGPFHWGDNDGNYLVNPPTGFYPDLMSAIFEEFKNLSGPDGVKYGDDITLERIWSKMSNFQNLFDGVSYITEPYFVIDATYSGTDEPCVNSTDCRPALLPEGKEQCNTYKNSTGHLVTHPDSGEPKRRCEHPERSRIDFFRFSCFTLGSASTFFTKRSSAASTVAPSGGLPGGIVAAIVICVLLLLIAVFAVLFLVYRERRGSPVFTKLSEE